MRFRTVLVVYLIALAVEIAALAVGSIRLEYIAKPMLMPVLIWYFAVNTSGVRSPRNALIAALLMSWFGDVFLLADKASGGYFIHGLGSFLVAHLFYIFYFLKVRKLNGVTAPPKLWLIVPAVFFGAALFGFVSPFIDDLFVPVAIYATVITTMLAASLAAFRFDGETYARLTVAGTALFVVSDSILAINRFIDPVPFGAPLVMLTYAGAQLLITEGAVRNLKD